MRLFALCQAMKWSHLPVPGGLYEQHPKLVEDFQIIFNEKFKYEAEEMAREKAKADNKMGRSRR